MSRYGIVIVSHVEELAFGISRLLYEIAPKVSVTVAGGTDDKDVGTSFDKTLAAFECNEAEELLCFYDLGSAKMTLEMVAEMSAKKARIYDTALIESAFTAATLLGAEVSIEEIEKQLADLKIK